MQTDSGLETLLELNGNIIQQEHGFWVEIHAWRIEPTDEVPHGIRFALPPISFMDFGKQDYIISMLSFYELGDTKFAAATFSFAYQKSCRRLRV